MGLSAVAAGTVSIFRAKNIFDIFDIFPKMKISNKLYNVEECRDLVGSLKVVENDVIQ